MIVVVAVVEEERKERDRPRKGRKRHCDLISHGVDIYPGKILRGITVYAQGYSLACPVRTSIPSHVSCIMYHVSYDAIPYA